MASNYDPPDSPNVSLLHDQNNQSNIFDQSILNNTVILENDWDQPQPVPPVSTARSTTSAFAKFTAKQQNRQLQQEEQAQRRFAGGVPVVGVSVAAVSAANPNIVYDPEDADPACQKELETVRKLNASMHKINGNLEAAREKLQQFSRTVDQTDQLLDLWISILSQSEHTKRLIDNPSWEGGVSDIIKIRQEEEQRQREREERERQAKITEMERIKREEIAAKQAATKATAIGKTRRPFGARGGVRGMGRGGTRSGDHGIARGGAGARGRRV